MLLVQLTYHIWDLISNVWCQGEQAVKSLRIPVSFKRKLPVSTTLYLLAMK